MTSLAVNYGVTPALVAKDRELKAQNGQGAHIIPRASYQTFGDSLTKESTAAEPAKSGLSTTTKVIAAGLASIVAAGIYILSKGKAKVANPVQNNITERLLSDGRKLTREIVKNEDGTQSTILKLLDKDGNLIKQKEKQIIRSVNPSNGKKYITKKEHYSAPGNFEANGNSANKDATITTQRYYDKSGKRLFETEEINAVEHSKSRKNYTTQEFSISDYDIATGKRKSHHTMKINEDSGLST